MSNQPEIDPILAVGMTMSDPDVLAEVKAALETIANYPACSSRPRRDSGVVLYGSHDELEDAVNEALSMMAHAWAYAHGGKT